MIVADVSRALLLLLLLAVHARTWLWILHPVAFTESVISLFFHPAKDALIPRLAGQQRLLAANALNALSHNLARLVGPPLGGALLSLAGFNLVVLMDSVSFLMSSAMIALISLPADQDAARQTPATPDPPGWTTLWHDCLEGLGFVKQVPLLTTVFYVSGTVMLAEGIINVLFVAFVQDVLQGDGLAFGWLMTVRGLGALVGGFIVGYVGKVMPPTHITILRAVGIGVIYLALFNIATLPLALVLFALSGVSGVAYGVGVQTLLQSNVADRYRGRIFGASSTTNALMLLGGAGLAGLLGDFLGVVVMLDVVAVLYIVAALGAMLKLRGELEQVSQWKQQEM